MDTFWQSLFDSIVTSVTAGGFQLIKAVLILIIGLSIVKFICRKIDKTTGRKNVDPTVKTFFRSFIKFLLYAVVLI